jgi:DNA-binding beta-propeller fold protein YncE
LRNSMKMRSFLTHLFTVIICLLLNLSGGWCAEADQPACYCDCITGDEEDARIRYPIAVYSEPVKNEIYVIDSMARIIIYTSDLFPIQTLDKRNGIDAPQGLTVDADGNLYVVQGISKGYPRCRISVYNACFKWVRDIHVQGFDGCDKFTPYRIAVDKQGKIYIAGLHYPGVIVTDNGGKFLEMLSPEENGRKAALNYVSIDKSGRIYLVSEEESRIYVYDEERHFLFKFGEKGGGSGKLSRPMSANADNRNGTIYIVDYMRHTISVYDRSGRYLSEFGGLGWGEGWFQHPRDIAVDSLGRILVADTFNDRIEIFRPNEKRMEQLLANGKK